MAQKPLVPVLSEGALAPEINRFVSHLYANAPESATAYHYSKWLRQFSRAHLDLPLASVTTEILEDYLNVTLSRCAPSTKRAHISVLRSFFKYLRSRGKIVENPAAELAYPKSRRRRPTYYSPEQVARILQEATAGRDKMLLTLLARHGQRVGAVIALRWREVDFERAIVHYPSTSDSKNAMSMPLDVDTARMMRAWRACNPDAGGEDYVFASRQGGHLGHTAVLQLIKRTCKRCGVPYRGAHEFRRTVATTLLQMGEPLHQVSRGVLGHSSVATTVAHYAGADDEDVAGMIRRLPY